MFSDTVSETLHLASGRPVALTLLDGTALDLAKSSDVSEGAQSIRADQFRLFNLVREGESHYFQDPHETTPALAGSNEAPDVRARIEMLAFHAGQQQNPKDDRATLRLDIGQDDVVGAALRPLFWSIAAGLDLASAAGGSPDSPRKYREDFDADFGQRPIEFPGGVAQLRFQVFAHRQQPWWRQIFSYLGSKESGRLISALGFPGITQEAVSIIDRAFDVLGDDHRVLFRSAKMTFALSALARETYTLGMPGIDIGVLNQGFALLAPHRHHETIVEQRPRFLATYGRLVPGSWAAGDFYDGGQSNPFDEIPYAVLRIRTESYSSAGGL